MLGFASWKRVSLALAAALFACGGDDGATPAGMAGGVAPVPSVAPGAQPAAVPPATGAVPQSPGAAPLTPGTPPPLAAPQPPSAMPQPGTTPSAMPPTPPVAPEPAWVPDYFPTSAWQEKPASELGFDSAMLDAAVSFAGQSATEAILVIQDGYIAAERYFAGFSAQRTHESYSMAKSVTSALVGIAIGEGVLSGVDDRICEAYAEWDCNASTDTRSQITVRHAMTLSTGLMWMEDWSVGADLRANDAFRMSSALGGPVSYVLAKPGAREPGTYFQYSTGDPALLTGVLQAATGKTALAYAQEKVFRPLGMTSASWNSDPAGRTTTFAGLQATARDYARFGFLFLNRGLWDGAQLVPAAWVDESTSQQSLEPWYGYLWHVNMPVKFEAPDLPSDGYTAQGVQGQYIAVIPSERLVIVRLAADGFNTGYDIAELFRRILAAKN